MEEFELGWIAAAFDGEGSLFVTKPGKPFGRSVHFVITNTNLDFLTKAQRFLGAGVIKRVKDGGRLGNKPIYRFLITRAPIVINLLVRLYPHLTVKRERARQVLASFALRPYQSNSAKAIAYWNGMTLQERRERVNKLQLGLKKRWTIQRLKEMP